MKKRVLPFIFLFYSFFNSALCQDVTVPVSYLEPKFTGSTSYDFLRIGNADLHYAGLMYNKLDNVYGKSASFSIFTYSNRNMNVYTGSGNFLINSAANLGNVGIGTTTPLAKLHVTGDMYLSGTTQYEGGWNKSHFYWKGHSLIMGSKEGAYAHSRIEIKPGGSASGTLVSNLELYNALNVGVHELKVNIASNNPSFFNGGNVGIGTANPIAKLHVNGTILASEVRVSTQANQVPDYVFKEDYQLISLSDLEEYIKTNNHLPQVPSAEEIEANGLELAKMNLLLLKKIEELTLYLIEERKTSNKQKETMEILSNEIDQLKKYIYEN